MKNIILLSLLLVLAVAANGQDPVKTSPHYYKVLLENDRVRVLEYRLKPGEKEPMHSHPAGVVYVLSGAKLKFSYPDGKTEEKAAATGETIWRDPVTHAVENIGDTEAHAIAVDVKTPTRDARAEPAGPSQTSPDEQALWNFERAYWRYVENNDLTAYRALWHEDFLGWPSVSAAPVRKDHITDWITSQTNQGSTFKALEFKPGGIQVTGNVAFACYWITFKWLDKHGNGVPRTLRITHAWLKTGKDWRIIGGMSMREPEPAAR